jgi:NAD-dependent dihydropyrimidine dehydrogenase PreA subunit
VGCGLCEQVCKFEAVTRVSDDPGRKGSWCADKE